MRALRGGGRTDRPHYTWPDVSVPVKRSSAREVATTPGNAERAAK